MTIEEFKKKYGERGVSLVVEEYINRAPPFKGDQVLAGELGEMMACLESVLKEVK